MPCCYAWITVAQKQTKGSRRISPWAVHVDHVAHHHTRGCRTQVAAAAAVFGQLHSSACSSSMQLVAARLAVVTDCCV
jgi:hypothetical protein